MALALVIPRSFENRSRLSPLCLPFTLRCDWSLRDLGPTLQPLVEDVDLDGHPDVFANTLDGSLLGVLRADLMNPDVATLADEEPYRWTYFHHRHQYLTNPVTLPTVYLRRSWFEDARGQNPHPISSYLSWVDRGPHDWLQMTPRILATPLSLPPGFFHGESWPLDNGRPPFSPLALLVAVNYLPSPPDLRGGSLHAGEEPSEHKDVLLAGLFGLTVCALAPSAAPCFNMRRSVETGQFFLPLELSKLSDRLPAYLLSTPVVGRDLLHANGDLGGLSYLSFFLLSSGSGLLHKLSLEALLWHALDYWSDVRSYYPRANLHVPPLRLSAPPSECVLVDCPSAPDQLCCLLSEAGSRLTLLALQLASIRYPPDAAAKGRVVWRFELPFADSVAAAVTFVVPTLVPSEEPVVLLPDAIGNIHAVLLKDGTPVQGSPAQNPFRNNDSVACSSVLTPGVSIVDDWLNRYVIFFSNCGRAAALDLRRNLTMQTIFEDSLDSTEVLSSLHEWFDRRQETSYTTVGIPRRDLIVAPSAHVGILRGSQGISAVAAGIVNTEGLPLVPLQTAKCLPARSTTVKIHSGVEHPACEINIPLDLSHAPVLAAPKGRISLLLFSRSGRLLVTSDVQVESITISVQQDTSLTSWLLVFSYLPIFLFVSIVFILPTTNEPMATSSNSHFVAPLRQ
ncbi:unnamed protein product [Schistocephalus solidus]|uniref:GPI transamidase component PIG-T n=1 Tax=Schistocephalus solidus TaxID=70667 RepID=A0A183T9T9_SCHSO|nr:unnamed protein product [Schistocephalus solidus]